MVIVLDVIFSESFNNSFGLEMDVWGIYDTAKIPRTC